MIYPVKKKILIPMLGISLLLLACIPRKEPVETLVLSYLVELPTILQENSGMIGLGSLIWFHNDGGNEPALYGYSTEQDSIVNTVVVKDVVNTDWEDITQNTDQIYIGDFGNNAAGNRTDLRIFIIKKDDLLMEADTITPSGTISFSYADQTDFTPMEENTSPFDCEAFIATEDSIFLFTKDWQTLQTRVYSLSVEPGTQVAKFRKQWNVSGLITAAVWSAENQELLLLGYTPLFPFIWVFSSFSPEDLSFTEGKRTDFSSYWGVQTEGIMISSDGTIYVSAERSPTSNAGLYRIEKQH